MSTTIKIMGIMGVVNYGIGLITQAPWIFASGIVLMFSAQLWAIYERMD